MTTKLIELRRKPHLSISQIKTFLMCPRKYASSYIQKIPPAFTPVALPFGSAFHDAIEVHLSESVPGKALPVSTLHDVFASRLMTELKRDGAPVLFSDETDSVDGAIALGKTMIDTFVRDVPLPDEVIEVELPFALELVHPVTRERCPVPLIGAVDALVVEDDRPVVLELKTAAKKWSNDQLEYDLSATAYTMAVRDMGHDVDGVKLLVTTKTKVPAVQVELLQRSVFEERELVETALSVVRAVDAGIDHPLRGWQCRSCPWAGPCAA